MSETTARPERDATDTSNREKPEPNGIVLDALTLDSVTLDSSDFFQLLKPTAWEKSCFSAVPEVLVEQAQRIEVWSIPQSAESALLPWESTESREGDPARSTYFLLFARDTKSSGSIDGCEIVAYPCDAVGRVSSWSHRYTADAINFSTAAQKLRFSIINGLAALHHVENA
ncbi:MAG TPA: hypothetical protein VF600_07630 [Abditibacteriaceae bacterium]|jgi:hypothetical protein